MIGLETRNPPSRTWGSRLARMFGRKPREQDPTALPEVDSRIIPKSRARSKSESESEAESSDDEDEDGDVFMGSGSDLEYVLTEPEPEVLLPVAIPVESLPKIKDRAMTAEPIEPAVGRRPKATNLESRSVTLEVESEASDDDLWESEEFVSC